MVSDPRGRLIVALDFDRLAPALAMARRLARVVGSFKVGSQLFTAVGPRGVERLAGLGVSIFLDLKFHDIPNTVAGAVRAAAALPGVVWVNVHALGGAAMLRAAAAALPATGRRPKLLAVTLLTSMDAAEARRVGLSGSAERRAVQLALLARRCRLDGVVASGRDVQAIRRSCGREFLVVVPGVRGSAVAEDDQARVVTPGAAIRRGADFIVVGRPITSAPDPVRAAAAIVSEIADAARPGV